MAKFASGVVGIGRNVGLQSWMAGESINFTAIVEIIWHMVYELEIHLLNIELKEF